MQRLTLAHTARFNRRNNHIGHAWQGRFKSILIEKDSYFLQCGRYIELNPVRAKLVSHPAQYRWSSYATHALGKTSGLVDQHSLHLALGSSPETRMIEYRKQIEEDPKPWCQISTS